MSSKPGKLSKLDLYKIAKGFAIAMAGAALTYVANILLPDLRDHQVINAGLFTLLSAAVNAALKFVTDTRPHKSYRITGR